MKVVLLNDAQRMKIISAIKPSAKDFFSYQNLNLLTAVSDEKNTFLTIARYMSSAITRTGDNADEYTYALLTPLGCFSVYCIERMGKISGISCPLPIIASKSKITEMIGYYHESFSEQRSLKKEAVKEMDLGNKDFTEWYLERNYFNK